MKKKELEQFISTRNKKIVERFENGENQRRLSLAFNITRERVRQIIEKEIGKKNAKKILLENKLKNAKRNEKTYVCKNCGKTFIGRYRKRTYCDIDCFRDYQAENSSSLEERMKKKRDYMRAYYHNKLKIN